MSSRRRCCPLRLPAVPLLPSRSPRRTSWKISGGRLQWRPGPLRQTAARASITRDVRSGRTGTQHLGRGDTQKFSLLHDYSSLIHATYLYHSKAMAAVGMASSVSSSPGAARLPALIASICVDGMRDPPRVPEKTPGATLLLTLLPMNSTHHPEYTVYPRYTYSSGSIWHNQWC